MNKAGVKEVMEEAPLFFRIKKSGQEKRRVGI